MRLNPIPDRSYLTVPFCALARYFEQIESQAHRGEQKLMGALPIFEARVDALEALWEVVLADGDVQDEELRVLDHAREVPGVSETDSARAVADAN